MRTETTMQTGFEAMIEDLTAILAAQFRGLGEEATEEAVAHSRGLWGTWWTQ